MRGPTEQSLAASASDFESSTLKEGLDKKHQQSSPIRHQPKPREESRLFKVKRALISKANYCVTSSNGNEKYDNRRIYNNNNRAGSIAVTTTNYSVFGLDLKLAEFEQSTKVPYVVYRLCNYIEAEGFDDNELFKLSNAHINSKLIESLKLTFDRRGDADLEIHSTPTIAVHLLKQFLKELPEPIVGPRIVDKLLQLHLQERTDNHEGWIVKSRELLLTELPVPHHRLLSYLLLFFRRYEIKHGRSTAGLCSSFTPILLPHLPPVVRLFNDMLVDANLIFTNCQSDNEFTVTNIIPNPKQKVCGKELNIEFSRNRDHHPHPAIKTSKRKDRKDSNEQEKKLIRSNSEEEVGFEDAGCKFSTKLISDSTNSIRRVSSHEDSSKHLHSVNNSQVDMGHGIKISPTLSERTNISPVSLKHTIIHSSSDVVLATEKFDCDAEWLRNHERFSRSIIPRERRQMRRRMIYRGSNYEQSASKESDNSIEKRENAREQSFMELLNSSPIRSPSPAGPATEQESTSQTLTDWGYQVRQIFDEEMSTNVAAMVSPRNSLLMPTRRFYVGDELESRDLIEHSSREQGLKVLVKQITSLKNKIKRYEGEFEENFGYCPSYTDKMSNRDIKRICAELHKIRKEHRILKEGFVGTMFGTTKLGHDENHNSNGTHKVDSFSIQEMVREIERKLAEKRKKFNRPENVEDFTYEQLLDEKMSMQKALLEIENTYGRPVSKEDRMIMRPLYEKYRTLKRLIIRVGGLKNKDSLSELATILEHEAMDFSTTNLVNYDRRASEPDMSNRGILDCTDLMEQIQTDSDSQHSNSEGSRGMIDSLHSLPREELYQQQIVTKEEKKRLRRALKELEIQFEARVGRRMQREDRGPQVNAIYESYKQTKAKLRLISALLAKSV